MLRSDIELLVIELYRAFSEGDRAAYNRLLRDDVIFAIPGDTAISGLHQGKAAVLDHLAMIADITRGTERSEILRMFIGVDSGVVVTHRSALRYGEEVTADYAEVFQLVNDQVTRMDVYPLSFDAMLNFYK